MESPEEILQRYWGFEKFRSAQKQVIDSVLSGNNTIALLPTGAGKSVCFQVPALAREGICIVISPLIALMQDQVNQLKKKGIRAMMIAGGLRYDELDKALDNCIYGNYKFVYISPERLQQELVQQRIHLMPVNLIAIDEAHCISEWGQDFRPSYQKLNILAELHPQVPLIALTATATERVIEDIKNYLDLAEATVIRYSFERENIAFLVHKSEDKDYVLLQFLRKNPGVGIIYVRTRKATLQVKDTLVAQNFTAEAYHGGLSSEEKKRLLEDWLQERFTVMIATTAFGMGIDKANVRNVVHYQLPESLESYFQEAGRAGRDGKESKALTVYNNSDLLQLSQQFLKVLPTPETVRIVYKKVNAYFSIAYGEGQETKHNFNFQDFCQTYSLPTSTTFNVLQLLDRVGIFRLSKEYHQRTELQFLLSNNHLYRYLEQNRKYKLPVQALLRLQGGYFEYKHPVNMSLLSNKTGISKDTLITLLQELSENKIIDLSVANQDTSLFILVPREDDSTINPIIPYIKQQYNNKEAKIKSVEAYLTNEETCKNIQLLRYFGEDKKTPCGKCSVCLKKQKKPKVSKTELKGIYEKIVALLRKKPLESREICNQLNFPEETIHYVLRLMLDKNVIRLNTANTYKLIK